MARELNNEEVRERFLEHIRGLVEYWGEGLDEKSKDKLDGLAFSILTTLDGCSGDMPLFIVAPVCTREDIEYFKKEDMDYYPVSPEYVECDISGCLHDLYYK